LGRLVAAAGVVLCTLSAPARALPAGFENAATKQILTRAEALLRGHPAEKKVALLAELPVSVSKVNTVHVLPRISSARVELRVEGAPCSLLETAIARVNAAIESLASLAGTVVAEFQAIAELQATLSEFERLHAADLAVARQGTLELMAIEAYLSELESALQRLREQELIALYESELSLARAEREQLRRDLRYLAAWKIEQESSQLLDNIASEHDAWTARHELRLASSEQALAEAQARYDELAAVEVGAAAAAFPIWDADVETLFAAGAQRSGIRFVPAVLENLAWTFEQGSLPRAVPIRITIESAQHTMPFKAARVEPLPGLVPLQGLSTLNFLDEEGDFRSSTTEYVDGADTRTRRTRVLASVAPRLRASLSLGAYCGSLHTHEVVVTEKSGEQTKAVLRAHRYELRLRGHSQLERYTATAAYEVKVEGRPLKIACMLEPGIVRLDGGGQSTMPAQLDQAATLPTEELSASVRGMSVRCTWSGLDPVAESEAQLILQEVMRDAAADPQLIDTQRAMSSGTVAVQSGRASLSVASGLQSTRSLTSESSAASARTAVPRPVSPARPVEMCLDLSCAPKTRTVLRPAPIFWVPGRLASEIDIQIVQSTSIGTP
jgi:hypothetical protein